MIQISPIVVVIKLLFKKIYNYQILYLEKIKEKKKLNNLVYWRVPLILIFFLMNTDTSKDFVSLLFLNLFCLLD